MSGTEVALWLPRPGGPVRGDIANLYRVSQGLLKIARDPADNDLMRREATALARLRDAVAPAWLAYFPRLVETQRRDDIRSGIRRHANLIGQLSGFRSLAEVRAAFPAGIDPRDAAWMWRRLLVAVGAAHRAGVIHGAVLPEHVMIHPGEHGLVLVDWCYSVPAPAGRVPAVVHPVHDRAHRRRPARPDGRVRPRLPAGQSAPPPAGRVAAATRVRRAARSALRAANIPPLRHAGLGITAKEIHHG
jgi:hypothetical protein